jgi:hypothetical protein
MIILCGKNISLCVYVHVYMYIKYQVIYHITMRNIPQVLFNHLKFREWEKAAMERKIGRKISMIWKKKN